MVLIPMTSTRECDTAMMRTCCGHYHTLQHFTTYRQTQAFLEMHKEVAKECPKWFKQKCRCYDGK